MLLLFLSITTNAFFKCTLGRHLLHLLVARLTKSRDMLCALSGNWTLCMVVKLGYFFFFIRGFWTGLHAVHLFFFNYFVDLINYNSVCRYVSEAFRLKLL